jgi:hypothetical protein
LFINTVNFGETEFNKILGEENISLKVSPRLLKAPCIGKEAFTKVNEFDIKNT